MIMEQSSICGNCNSESDSTTGAPSPDTRELVLCHRSDTIVFSQCCEISADGGDVPNETKPAKTIEQ